MILFFIYKFGLMIYLTRQISYGYNHPLADQFGEYFLHKSYNGRPSPAGPLQGLEREPGQAGNRAALSGSGSVQASLVGLGRPYLITGSRDV